MSSRGPQSLSKMKFLLYLSCCDENWFIPQSKYVSLLLRSHIHCFDTFSSHGAEALRCLENWGIGCIPACPDFGVSVSHLSKEQVLPSILEVIYRGEENISHVSFLEGAR